MNINLQASFSRTLNDVQNSVLRPFTRQQKQILWIAAAAIGFLVSCILAYRCYYKTKASDLKEFQKEKKAPSKNTEGQWSEVKPLQTGWASPKPANERAEANRQTQKTEEVLDLYSDLAPSPKKRQPSLGDDILDDEAILDPSPKMMRDEPTGTDFYPYDDSEKEFQTSRLVSPLIPLGKIRKNVTPGEPPNSLGLIYFENERVHDSENQATVMFACCFHTEESHEEIYQLLRDIRKKIDSDYFLSEKRRNEEAFATLSSNLERLREALPGPDAAKELKIYWSNSVEEELIPYLFECEDVKISDLVFAIIPGERADSNFQAAEMNFNVQLQFIGVGQTSLVEPLAREINSLSEEMLGIRMADIIGPPIKDYMLTNYDVDVENVNRLMGDAFLMNLMRNVYFNLLDLRAQNKGVDLTALDPEDRNHYVKELLGPPSSH